MIRRITRPIAIFANIDNDGPDWEELLESPTVTIVVPGETDSNFLYAYVPSGTFPQLKVSDAIRGIGLSFGADAYVLGFAEEPLEDSGVFLSLYFKGAEQGDSDYVVPSFTSQNFVLGGKGNLWGMTPEYVTENFNIASQWGVRFVARNQMSDSVRFRIRGLVEMGGPPMLSIWYDDGSSPTSDPRLNGRRGLGPR